MGIYVALFSGVAGIHFPVGKLGEDGTCEFATEKCLKECAAFKNGTEANRVHISNKRQAYYKVTQNDPQKVIWEIASEVKRMKTSVLYWFASGDCPSKDTEKIAHIMEGLSFLIPAQIGFTRNQKLWEKINSLHYGDKPITNVRLALTLEKPYKSRLQQMSYLGTIAVPDYKKGIVNLYSCNRSHTACGADIVYVKTIDKIEEKKADCSNCYKEKTGCFKDWATGEK